MLKGILVGGGEGNTGDMFWQTSFTNFTTSQDCGSVHQSKIN